MKSRSDLIKTLALVLGVFLLLGSPDLRYSAAGTDDLLKLELPFKSESELKSIYFFPPKGPSLLTTMQQGSYSKLEDLELNLFQNGSLAKTIQWSTGSDIGGYPIVLDNNVQIVVKRDLEMLFVDAVTGAMESVKERVLAQIPSKIHPSFCFYRFPRDIPYAISPPTFGKAYPFLVTCYSYQTVTLSDLWVTDGTLAGTAKIAELPHGAYLSATYADNKTYIFAEDPSNYLSNSTQSLTALVYDQQSKQITLQRELTKPGFLLISNLTFDNDRLYFTAATAAPGKNITGQNLHLYSTSLTFDTPVNLTSYIENGSQFNDLNGNLLLWKNRFYFFYGGTPPQYGNVQAGIASADIDGKNRTIYLDVTTSSKSFPTPSRKWGSNDRAFFEVDDTLFMQCIDGSRSYVCAFRPDGTFVQGVGAGGKALNGDILGGNEKGIVVEGEDYSQILLVSGIGKVSALGNHSSKTTIYGDGVISADKLFVYAAVNEQEGIYSIPMKTNATNPPDKPVELNCQSIARHNPSAAEVTLNKTKASILVQSSKGAKYEIKVSSGKRIVLSKIFTPAKFSIPLAAKGKLSLQYRIILKSCKKNGSSKWSKSQVVRIK